LEKRQIISVSSKIVVGVALHLRAAPAGLAQNWGVPNITPQNVSAERYSGARRLDIGADFSENRVAGAQKRVDQFELRVGDIVNPVKRSAGTLIPAEVDPALDHGPYREACTAIELS
jgi:hypothetical protein